MVSESGTFFVGAETPYEWELLFEYATHCAERSGSAMLEVNGLAWRIGPSAPGASVCTTCGRNLEGLSYYGGEQRLCRTCARRDFRSTGALPQPAARPPHSARRHHG